MTKEEGKALLALDWKNRMAAIAPLWVGGGVEQIVLNEAKVTDCGKAAILQDVDKFIKQKGVEAWNRVKASHRAQYGRSDYDRRSMYWQELFGQLRAGKDRLGITL